jgi:hypothetical protein
VADTLWHSTDSTLWFAALNSYSRVIARQEVASLPAHDEWYSNEFPKVLASRTDPHITHAELVRVTEWKMSRGVWRAPNLVRVRSNAPKLVIETTTKALALCPHPTAPIREIATLDGVGPATASAVTAVLQPWLYPFFDELVAAQVPDLGPVDWTLGYYARYAEQLRRRAVLLGGEWTAVMVERALWAGVGGKVGRAALIAG